MRVLSAASIWTRETEEVNQQREKNEAVRQRGAEKEGPGGGHLGSGSSLRPECSPAAVIQEKLCALLTYSS